MNKAISLFWKRKVPVPAKPEVALRIKAPLLMTFDDALKQKRVTSRLAVNASNIGDLMMEGGLQVLGAHEGDVTVTGEASVVWVCETGCIKGNIDAPQVYIQGRVQGSVRADMVVLEGKGAVEGEILANRVLLRSIDDIALKARVRAKETVIGLASVTPIGTVSAASA